MSTATIVIERDSPGIPRPLSGDDSASKRLKECARVLREHVKRLQPQPATPAATWLLENHSFLQFQIRETRASLPASYLRVLPKTGEGAAAEIVEAIFHFYENRGFQPTLLEREKMLNL